MNLYWWIGVGLAFLLVAALWLVIPALYGTPWVPTREARIRRALLVEVEHGDLRAAQPRGLDDGEPDRPGADDQQAVVRPRRAAGDALGVMRIWLSGNRHKVQLRCGNFYRADLSAADVVFVYLTSSQTTRLQDKLEQELRPGARVVSVAADFPGWQPVQVDRESVIFLYQM